MTTSDIKNKLMDMANYYFMKASRAYAKNDMVSGDKNHTKGLALEEAYEIIEEMEAK